MVITYRLQRFEKGCIDPVDSIFLNILLFKCTVLSSSVLYCQRFQILMRLVQAEKKVNHLLATLQNEGPI